MENIVQRVVSVETFAMLNASHPYFKIGYDSIMKNLPDDYNIADKICAVRYASGRMFAIW